MAWMRRCVTRLERPRSRWERRPVPEAGGLFRETTFVDPSACLC